MKLRKQRKQFWWTWAGSNIVEYPIAFGVLLRQYTFTWKVSRIKHQLKN